MGQQQTIVAPTGSVPFTAATLLFSHGTWIILSATPTFFVTGFMPLLEVPKLRPVIFPLGIGWASIGLFTSLYTVYLIIRSWRAARHVPRRIFNDFSFFVLLFVMLLFLGGNVWTLVAFTQL